MVTRNDIHEFLKENGIKSNDTVIIHTSMRSLGGVEGGCDGLIDAFTSYLSDGLFIIPTHTWATVGSKTDTYEVKTSIPCIGALPTVAISRRDGVRSLHPTHSMTAFGKRAKEFLKGEEKATSPCQIGGAWARLYDEGAKILLIGVGLERNTYIHAVDEMIDVPERLGTPREVKIIGYNGERYETTFRPHARNTSTYFPNYEKPFVALGAYTKSKLGDATVGICDARKATEILKLLWSRTDHDFCREVEEIPEEYYLS